MRCQFLVFVLQLIQLEVNPSIGEKLLVGAHFPQLGFMHHDDFVGTLHVESRWAMMIDVRPSTIFASASRTLNSVSVSTLEVASSKIKIFGACASARAKEINCFCPVENVDPRSWTSSL